MKETENISLDHEELEYIITDLGEKINGYMDGLKKSSSNEILNGSVQKAQKLLDKIVMVEDGINKVNSAHEYLLTILKQESVPNINQSFVNEKSLLNETDDKEEISGSNNGTKKSKLRLPLLKALIYLGGSAEESDMIDFINKEKDKILSKEELKEEKNSDGKEWMKMLKNETQKMISEGLVNHDKSKNHWEITQSGIDFLSKNDE